MSDRRTLLLLGSRGFAGKPVREAAEKRGLHVVGTSRDGDGAELACNLLDPASLAAALATTSPSLVVNMAGSSSVAASFKHPAESFAVNATGAVNLLQAVVETAPDAHVTCVSSAQVYGNLGRKGLPLLEDQPPAPASPYGEAKAAMEKACRRYSAEGARVAIVRAFNMIGPGQDPGLAASGFAKAIAEAEARGGSEAVIRVGNLDAARDFVDVRDAAEGFAGISDLELTGTYNLCSGRAVSLRALIDLLAEATPLPVRVCAAPELIRPADVPVSYGSAARLRKASGWEPAIPLPETLGRLLDWWRGRFSCVSRQSTGE